MLTICVGSIDILGGLILGAYDFLVAVNAWRFAFN